MKQWATLLLCLVVALATMAGGAAARDTAAEKPYAVSATAVGANDPCGLGDHRHLGDVCLAASGAIPWLTPTDESCFAGRETAPFAVGPDHAMIGKTIRPRPHPPKPPVRA